MLSSPWWSPHSLCACDQTHTYADIQIQFVWTSHLKSIYLVTFVDINMTHTLFLSISIPFMDSLPTIPNKKTLLFLPDATYFFEDPFEADPYASYAIDTITKPSPSRYQHQRSIIGKHHFVRRHHHNFHSNGKVPGSRPKFPVATRTEEGGPKMYRCHCGRNYSLLRNFNYHSRWECGRVYDCPKCAKQYKDVSSYRKHLQMCDAPASAISE